MALMTFHYGFESLGSLEEHISMDQMTGGDSK
jgi:hypothetical protein